MAILFNGLALSFFPITFFLNPITGVSVLEQGWAGLAMGKGSIISIIRAQKVLGYA